MQFGHIFTLNALSCITLNDIIHYQYNQSFSEVTHAGPQDKSIDIDVFSSGDARLWPRLTRAVFTYSYLAANSDDSAF